MQCRQVLECARRCAALDADGCLPSAGDFPAAFSFNSDTLSVDSIESDPTVDASTVVPNLKSLALSGFDKVNILAAVDLAQDDITNLKVVSIHRHHGA
jgi:hypothetical protein